VGPGHERARHDYDQFVVDECMMTRASCARGNQQRHAWMEAWSTYARLEHETKTRRVARCDA
jgi:hypothetical protein